MRYSFKRLIVCNVVGYDLAEIDMADGPVLALHGENGAGKTALLAMLMATLVPEPPRIDHAVRGGSKTKSGLAGRVCLHGGPSYAVLEVGRGSITLLLGVQFRNGDKPLPDTVPFVIEGLPAGLPATDWLLKQTAADSLRAVPTLDDLRQAIGRLGGRLQEFARPSDYYGRLDELGVLPNPLSSQSEREQWANIFLFGFGRRPDDIVAGLKDYLLAEDDTLQRSVEAMDESFRSVVDCRSRISRYRTHVQALTALWTGVSRAVSNAAAAARSEHERLAREELLLTGRIEGKERERRLAGSSIAGAEARKGQLDRLEAEANGEFLRARDSALRRRTELEERVRGADEYIHKIRKLERLRTGVRRPIREASELVDARAFLSRRRDRAQQILARLPLSFPELASPRTRSSELSLHPAHMTDFPKLSEHPRLRHLGAGEAALIEAALGPAVRAMITPEPKEAARRALAEHPGSDHLWFIGPVEVDGAIDRAAADLDDSIEGAVVHEGPFVRASPRPTRPVLGSAAREAAARRLARARALLESLRKRSAAAEALLEDAISLTGVPSEIFGAGLESGDDVRELRTAFDRGFVAAETGADAAFGGVPDADRALLEALSLSMRGHSAAKAAVTAHATEVAVAKSDDKRLRDELEALRARSTEIGSGRMRAQAELAAWLDAAEADSTLAALVRAERSGSPVGGVEPGAGTEFAARATKALLDVMRLSGTGTDLHRVADGHGLDLTARSEAALQLRPAEMLALWSDAKALALVLVPDDLVAATGDPVRDLELLASAMAHVEHELEAAERTFRDRASRLEPNILGAIRRGGRRIERLSRSDTSRSFGSFEAIRLRVVRSEPMLEALRAITSREPDLFSSGERLQDALPRIHAAIETERGHTLPLPASGIFDYRTYVSVQVEVRRRDDPDWRPLHSTGASNGEDIGVSFVALCSILEEWERRRASLTGQHQPTCLRLLLLDEATQIDDRGLATIAGFAEDLGATVVLASPSVVRVAGRSTVYSLVGDAASTNPRVRLTLLQGRVVHEQPGQGPITAEVSNG